MAAKGTPKETVDVWKEEYESGLSFAAIARKYGVASGTVRKNLKGKVKVREKGTSKDVVEEWYRLYMSGVSKTAIAKQHNTDCTTVSRVLAREKGVKRIQGAKEFEHLIPTFKRMYESGYDLTDISEKTNVSRQTVLNYLNAEGVTIRTYSEATRMYDVKDDYFDVIDSERKAYILGLIFSSGTIIDHRDSNSLQIVTAKRREYVIQEVFGELTDKPKEDILFSASDNSYKDRIFSKTLYDRLKELGLGLKGEISMPNIDKKYVKSFLKGHLADSASFYEKRNYIRIGGRPTMMGAIRNLLTQCVGVNPEAVLNESKRGHALAVFRKAEVEKIKEFMKGTRW
ncbi:helix-turn-helix domain-containing protein [Bacillus paranthracis]|uniref:helix-turn-helix domain-containing protein n=1 Tax=Bacillus paranthracis TaxID=2026186 RepID=UPI00187A3500|nr:helix-turn-helix domain-containing protein [Bacillus paranthracis]MBE7114468.1 helix-turn-helix domain-containing protein [Bacillus paranthracis]MBE7154658.1 helix-turn-helix domain-containing protein [Bacillus paranthracis]